MKGLGCNGFPCYPVFTTLLRFPLIKVTQGYSGVVQLNYGEFSVGGTSRGASRETHETYPGLQGVLPMGCKYPNNTHTGC